MGKKTNETYQASILDSDVKKSGNAAFDKMIDMTIRQFMMGGSLRFASPPQNWRLQTIPILVDGSDIR